MPTLSSLKSFFLEKALLPTADFLTRQRVMTSYQLFRESQWWSRDKLLEYQRVRLHETLMTTYEEVPLYRERFNQHGIHIEELSKLRDLARIPSIGKDDLRGAYPDRCVRKTPYPAREFFTSGSSGRPFAVKVDSRTMSNARALMLLRANFSGWEFGDPFLQTGMSLDRGVVKRVKDCLLGVQYVSAFDLSDQVLDHYLSLIEDHQLLYLMGYPGSIYYLAKRAKELGFNNKLNGIVCWGDNLYQHYRDEMETAFGCRVTDTYGCGEGIQVAAQCEEGAYHIFMPHVIVEVVDDTGLPVKKGTSGEILLTRLDAGAMPLIRYKVGDIGRKGKALSCPCGRGWETLEAIEGRDTDVIITPRGNRLIVHFFTGIFEYFPSIDTFKVTQHRPGAIFVEIVPRPEFKSGDWEKIKMEIQDKSDPDLEIEMALVDVIPLEASNKRRFVVSKLESKERSINVIGV